LQDVLWAQFAQQYEQKRQAHYANDEKANRSKGIFEKRDMATVPPITWPTEGLTPFLLLNVLNEQYEAEREIGPQEQNDCEYEFRLHVPLIRNCFKTD